MTCKKMILAAACGIVLVVSACSPTASGGDPDAAPLPDASPGDASPGDDAAPLPDASPLPDAGPEPDAEVTADAEVAADAGPDASTSAPSITIGHCSPIATDRYDCGDVLVGAAQLEPDSISWTGNGNDLSMELQGAGPSGFSGPSDYMSQMLNRSYDWLFDDVYNVVSTMAPGVVDTYSIGHFFAPDAPGFVESPNRYVTLGNNAQDILNLEPYVQGVGIADTQTAITLDVGLNEVTQACADEPVQCRTAVVGDAAPRTFTITPLVDPTKLPAGLTVDHVLVRMVYGDDVGFNSGCVNYAGQFFETTVTTPNEWANTSAYLHYLGTGGPTFTNAACGYNVAFLVSVGKPFDVTVSRLAPSPGRTASYIFFVNGHLDLSNPASAPGAQQVIRLTSQ